MNLRLDINLVSEYKSNAQIARVLTEDWLMNNGKPVIEIDTEV